jgi:alpha-D-ribose 1-methylphosphonate 5-triphosphate diphosphatase PhnM
MFSCFPNKRQEREKSRKGDKEIFQGAASCIGNQTNLIIAAYSFVKAGLMNLISTDYLY